MWLRAGAFRDAARVPKDAAAAMEAALKRVYDGQAYKDYAERNMVEDAYLGSADFAKALVVQRAEQVEFLKAMGIVKSVVAPRRAPEGPHARNAQD